MSVSPTHRPARHTMLDAIGLLVAMVVLGACSVPQDDAARIIEARTVPFDLLSPTTTGPQQFDQGVQTKEAFVYLAPLNGTQLVPRKIVVTRVNADSVLRALFDTTPAPDENLRNLLIGGSTMVKSIDSSGDGPIRVEFDSLFELEGEQLSLATAQIIFTLATYFPNRTVEFYVDDQIEKIRTPDGMTLDQGSTEDFALYAPPKATTGTTN